MLIFIMLNKSSNDDDIGPYLDVLGKFLILAFCFSCTENFNVKLQNIISFERFVIIITNNCVLNFIWQVLANLLKLKRLVSYSFCILCIYSVPFRKIQIYWIFATFFDSESLESQYLFKMIILLLHFMFF